MLDIIAIPLGWIIKVCYSLVNNYFVALLLFALVMQIILLPFSIKQQKNSVQQAKLAPKTAAIRKKYAGRNDAQTQQKMQQEIQEMYQKEKFSPFGGCLPLLIQMPILLALYNVVMNPLRYITGISMDTINQIQTHMTDDLGIVLNPRGLYIDILNHVREDLPYYVEKFADLADKTLPDMTFIGTDLSQIPTFTFQPFDWLMLVPILTFVFMLLTQKITRMFTYQSPETIEAQKSPSMKIMNWSMPLLSVWIAFSVPAAIGLYWIFRNIISCIQQIILANVIPAPRFTEEDYKRAEKEMKVPAKPRREISKVPPKSLHHIDDEEYQAKLEAAWEKAKAEEEKASEPVKEEEAVTPAPVKEEKKDEAPILKEDDKVKYEKKVTPTSGPKYPKTGKNYKK
ncbi:MAG: membrane protein insertase YidC [Clostridia bacterium]|nr:membrane protein insertase YidC [Clostridia bacterium]